MVEFKYLRILILNSKNLRIYEFKYRPIYEYNLQITNLTRTYSLEDAFARHLKNVLKTFLQDFLKMFWRCFCKTSWRRMAKTNMLVLTNTSWRRLEDVFWRRRAKANIFVLIKTSWRGLQDVFWRRRRKTSSGRLHQDECLLGFILLLFWYILRTDIFFVIYKIWKKVLVLPLIQLEIAS